MHRDVAQLVAHYVRDVGVGRSSRLIPTLGDKWSNSLVAFSIPSLQLLENKRNIQIISLYSWDQSDLTAIVVWRGKTLVTDSANALLDYANEIKSTLASEEITENDINGKYHPKQNVRSLYR